MTGYSEKQIQIMEAAEELFANKGFDGTSVRDIASEAGVNLAMISYYFGSKEKLMVALFDCRMGDFKLRMESILQNETMSPMEKICQVIDHYVEKIMNRQFFHKIMARE